MAPPVAELIWSKTLWRVSLVEMVICAPLTVKVPAVMGVANPAEARTRDETSSVGLRPEPAPEAPCRTAAEAN